MKPTGNGIRRSLKVSLAFALLFVGTTGPFPVAIAQSPGTFRGTGKMTTARSEHTATLLANGKVLIAGGWSARPGPEPTAVASAELFDPDTGLFTPTGDMTAARASHAAILLPDGKVLIAGGTARSRIDSGLASAELYDPSTETFSPTEDMVAATPCATATLLDNGKVLVAGGVAGPPPYGVQLYDPATATFTAAGTYASFTPDNNSSVCPTATLLTNGKVLVARPFPNDTELYDPSTGTFTTAGFGCCAHGVGETLGTDGGTRTLLKDGRLLAVGGVWGDDLRSSVKAELYDPASGTVTPTSDMPWGRFSHTATLLPSGMVLVAGGGGVSCVTNFGCAVGGVLATGDLYDPSAGMFVATGYMASVRSNHTATLLNNGQVLMTGGDVGYPTSPVSSAELYIPSPLVIPSVVTDLRFDVTTVAAGTSYSVNVSGSNLTAQTFFDVRFSVPGSNDYAVALNWQRGLTASHNVLAGTTSGTWTINGVRAHEDEAEHTGSFAPMLATITVAVSP